MLVGLVVAALLAGCADEQSPKVGVESNSPISSPLLPKAADGTDLAACTDAVCEVEVKSGDELKIDAKFRVDTVIVKAIGEDAIALALKGSAGGPNVEGRNVSSSVRCVNGNCSYTGELAVTTENPERINDVRVSLLNVNDDRAILKLAAR
jgi:hypothetical protein